MLVKATREGLIGQMTATGWKIDAEYPFVALPSHKALGMWISLRNQANGKHCCAQVLDVGPWNTEDDAYVFGNSRPAAESGQSVGGLRTNGAGIDLGEKVWGLLGMRDNGEVEWRFVA
jgi:hypothetical protein